MDETKYGYIGHCNGCDHVSHDDDLNECPDCENHFHDDCAGWVEIDAEKESNSFVCESCAEDTDRYPFQCKPCQVLVRKDQVMTPVMFGFFGNTWMHKRCHKTVIRR